MFVFYSIYQEELQKRINQTTPKRKKLQRKEYDTKTNNFKIGKLKYKKFNQVVILALWSE